MTLSRLKAVTAVAAFVVPFALPPADLEGRSFVGRKLSGITFVDTEGHTVNPDHYRGSVLVMIAGIPW